MVAHRRPDAELSVVPPDSWEAPRVGDSDSDLDWRRWTSALRTRWWLVVAAVAVTTVAMGLVSLRQPRLYRAATTLVLEMRQPRVLTGMQEVYDVGQGVYSPSFFDTEFEVMRSRAVARLAADRLGLAQDDRYNGTAGLDAAAREKKLAELDSADLLHGLYTVGPEKKNPSIVRISVEHTDKEFATRAANAIGEAYRDQNIDRRSDSNRDASTWLAGQHDDLRKKTRESEAALMKFMEDNDVLNASVETQLDEVKQRLSAFNAQLATEEATRIRDAVNVEALKLVRADPAMVDTLPEIQSAGVINALKERLIEIRALEIDLSARYLPDHPRMKLLIEQRETIQRDLQREVDAVLTSLERQKASRDQSIEGLRAALAEERQREARLNKLTLEYDRFKRERDTNVALYDKIVSRMKETDITGNLPFNNVRVLEEARTPKYPFKPNYTQNLIIGVVLGLLLGLLLVLALEFLDNRVKSQEDLERITDVPFLGLMPLIASDAPEKGMSHADAVRATRTRDLYILREPRSAVAECARFIRTNLLFMSPDRPLRTLAVTSPSPQEGKTTTAVSVAITMAQAGSRVLIVDTDMRKPRLHRVFDADAERGLSSVLVGEATLEQAIGKTEVANLDVLPCGPIPPNPAEILLSDRFRETVAELSRRYDRVIFDTPPIGPVTDPAIMGAVVDGIVLVAKCERTTKESVKLAVRALRDANARIFGIILNDVDVTNKRYSGAYYAYYRRYGAYYGETDEAKT